jgi:hypothetical protein
MTSEGKPPPSTDTTCARRALQSLNFFMADMQAGITLRIFRQKGFNAQNGHGLTGTRLGPNKNGRHW